MACWTSVRAVVRALDLEEDAWVEALFTEARGLFDEGLGMFVYTYRIEPGPSIRLGSVAGRQTSVAFWQTLGEWGADNVRSLVQIYETGASSLCDAVRSAGQRGVALTDARAKFDAQSVADVFTIVGHDAGGYGVFLTVPRTRPSPAPTSKQRLAIDRLSVELAAMARLREHHRRTQVARLTVSERLVARRLVEGASDKAIALDLGVSLSTVSTFTRRLRRKLGCRSGEEALALSSLGALARFNRRLDLFDRLTAAECDIAAALLVGSSHADIAIQRGVSVRTVASQCGVIFRKCDVSGRRALAATLLGGTSGK